MTRYKQEFRKMWEQEKDLFDSFKKIHDGFVKNPDSFQFRFNKVGKKVVAIIREQEAKLCGKTERGVYSKFSANLSDKFWGEARIQFPKIDFIGVKIN